jgi:3-isopropylmalate/(R)-2-methylmalate dehydratase small subunit
VGDHIDTDAILPGPYLGLGDERELGRHALEGLGPEYPAALRGATILVAGENFGCGSSREHATLALKGAGIRCVVARSFARIFYRNAINVGLTVVELADADRLGPGDDVEVDPVAGSVVNHTRGERFAVPPYGPMVQAIIAEGGLVAFVRKTKGRK